MNICPVLHTHLYIIVLDLMSDKIYRFIFVCMNVYTYIYTCMNVCISIYIYIYIYAHTHIYIYICMRVCIFMCVCVCSNPEEPLGKTLVDSILAM